MIPPPGETHPLSSPPALMAIAILLGDAGRHDDRMGDPPDVTAPTATLLWEACGGTPIRVAIGRALAAGADVAWAVRAATDQRIVGLLWRRSVPSDALGALGPDRVAVGDMADALEDGGDPAASPAVALAVQPLTAAGLEPIIFKGPAVAALAGPGLRSMDDIDLLLPRADHRHAVRHPGRAGWEVARGRRRRAYDTVLTHVEVPSFFLEVHFGLGPAAKADACPARLWAPAPAAPVCRHLRLRVAPRRGVGGAGSARGQTPPPVRAVGVDGRPRHDRRACRENRCPDRLGCRARRGPGRPV